VSTDQAKEISASGVTVDVGDATTRYLLYGLLPSWFVPGVADWVMHRRTRIEETAGTKESLILPHCLKGVGGAPTLMMAEVGIPIALTLRYEVNPLLLSVQLGGAAVHEATAGRPYGRRQRAGGQAGRAAHPQLSGVAAVRGAGLPDVPARRPGEVAVARRPRGPRRVAAGAAPATAVARLSGGHRRGDRHCVLLPYGEELLRCVRTGRRNRKNEKKARSDAARWSAARAGKGT
jgi:hypothetical protein